jgi:hypothetical protein
MVRWAAIDRRFAWVLVIPYYLLKTRGLRGLLSAMGFWALAITPTLVSQVILLTRGK